VSAPLVGVTAATALDSRGFERASLNLSYLRAIEAAGAVPLVLTPGMAREQLRAALGLCVGLSPALLALGGPESGAAVDAILTRARSDPAIRAGSLEEQLSGLGEGDVPPGGPRGEGTVSTESRPLQKPRPSGGAPPGTWPDG